MTSKLVTLFENDMSSELMREPQVSEPRDISTAVKDDLPFTTSPTASTTETEARKRIPVVDTQAINPEPGASCIKLNVRRNS